MAKPTTRAEIKAVLALNNVRAYDVANHLGISEATFQRLLRKPIDEETSQKILDAVDSLSKKEVKV